MSGSIGMVDVDVFEVGTPGWEDVRTLFDASLDRRPGRAFRPHTLSAAVNLVAQLQREEQPFTIKSGGHSAAGLSVAAGVPVIDMSMLRRVQVDTRRQLVTLEAGALMADLDAATERVSMATTGGTVSHTGVVGLACGGGLGWLMGRLGLACDNIVEATIISSGETRVILEASPEMFMVRGAGTALGFIAELTMRIHHVEPWFHWTTWSCSAGSVLDAAAHFGRCIEFVPKNVGTSLSITSTQEGSLAAIFDVISPAGEADAASWCDEASPIRAKRDDVLLSYLGIQRRLDPQFPFGMRSYRRSLCVDGVDELNLTALVDELTKPSPLKRTLTIDVLHDAAMEANNRERSCFQRYPLTCLFVCQWPSADFDQLGRRAGREMLYTVYPTSRDHNYVAYGNYSSAASDSEVDFNE